MKLFINQLLKMYSIIRQETSIQLTMVPDQMTSILKMTKPAWIVTFSSAKKVKDQAIGSKV